jgi:hypothetical protein
VLLSLLLACRGSQYPDSDWWQYSRTKLMNLMTGKEMARRLAGSGVEVRDGLFCLHGRHNAVICV